MELENLQEINQLGLGKVPHLIVGLANQFFALEIQYIQEILSLPKTVPIPNCPPFLRGAINLRGKVVPVLDLKMQLNMQSENSETEHFLEMLFAREKDHLLWVEALEQSLRLGLAFQSARDHHMCAFGKWFYTYKAPTTEMAQILKQMEKPHERLHKSAEELLSLTSNGKRNEAIEQLALLRKNELRTLRGLFEALRAEVQSWQNEQVVILKKEELQLGICVDSVKSTEIINVQTIEEVYHSELKRSGLIKQTARSAEGDVLLLLDLDPLLA